MPVISATRDEGEHALTLIAEFDADLERVWQLWEDPRQLEQWWGPPGWPSTVTLFEFEDGGQVRSYMTDAAGERAGEWWRFASIRRPTSLAFDGGFADAEGHPFEDLPVGRFTVTLEPLGERTRQTVRVVFASTADFEQVLSMGMDEGMSQAMGQVDDLLGG